MKFGCKESFLIAVIGSILVIYVVYFATLTGPKRYSSWSLMTAASHDSIKEEFELPPITPDYTRTEGFLSKCGWNGMDGVTISLQYIWSVLALATLINRTFIMPNLPIAATMRGRDIEFIPFADLFDINVLRRAYGPNCCASPSEVDKSIGNYTRIETHSYRLLEEFNGNKSQLVIHKHIHVCGTSSDFLIKANITSVQENTQPHPALKKIIRSGWHQLQGTETDNTTSHSYKRPPIICMHLRTEPDFMYTFFHAPAAYTREQILMKMNLTRKKLPDTSFAKLWSQNKNHEGKPVLYLAGGDRKDNKQFFMNTGWFSRVEDKDSLFINNSSKITSFAQLLIMYNAPSSLMSSLRWDVSTVLAIIDLEICKKADIFIGNNHSSFSERIASERQRSSRWEGNANRTLENGGKYNYMVNGLSTDSASWEDFSKLEPLHPFCAATAPLFLSYKCNYVRLQF